MNEQLALQDNATAVIKPEGDLVLAALPTLRSKMRDMVSAGILHLTVDLSRVQMVDSSGLGLLISAHNSLKKVGGQLAVVHASKDILHLFKTMRMHQHFSISGSQE